MQLREKDRQSPLAAERNSRTNRELIQSVGGSSSGGIGELEDLSPQEIQQGMRSRVFFSPINAKMDRFGSSIWKMTATTMVRLMRRAGHTTP